MVIARIEVDGTTGLTEAAERGTPPNTAKRSVLAAELCYASKADGVVVAILAG